MENKKKLLEAILFMENNPIKIADLENMLGVGSLEFSSLVTALEQDLRERESALKIAYSEDKIYLKPDEKIMEALVNIYGEKEKRRFNRASLEVLSIIAWKQPVTRSEIEAIRGVDSSHSIRTLLEEDFIKVVGRKEVLGRPQIYGTTERFLNYFGLKSIEELPRIDDLKEIFE